MNNYSKIYWLTRLDSIENLFWVLMFLCGIVILVYWLILFLNADFEGADWPEQYKTKNGKKPKIATWIGVISMFMLTFLPNKNDAILILAGGKTMDFIEKDKSMNKLPAQTTAIISKYLDNTLKEMKKADKKPN